MYKLHHLKTPLLALGLALSVAACDISPYDALQSNTSDTGAFSNALAAEYKEFAKSEIDQYDWIDQQTFAQKGLTAAAGKRPLPEQPDDWRLEGADLGEFHATRADLISWLDTNGHHITPVKAAKAQRSFDCWVEQKEENWQTDDIRACREGLRQNMPYMSQIQFPFDSAALQPYAKARLKRIALDWRKNPGNFLLIQGHADKHGRAQYNYQLSKKRALAVGQQLAQLGVAKADIRFEIWGEERPRPSAARSQLLATDKVNRRVEVLKF